MFTTKYSIEALREMKFGLLQVIDEAEPRLYTYNNVVKRARMMNCSCDCGKTNIVVSLNNLIRQHTLSCGCYKATYSKQFLKNYKGEQVEKIS